MASLLRDDWTRSARQQPLAFLGFALLLLLAFFSLTLASLTSAQAQTIDKTSRKVVESYKPEYPKSLKEAHIGGLVRLNVTVRPNGEVAEVEVLGGNPIFVETATKAVRKWKYVPAAAQTQEDVHIHFTPD
jgi:TonB family protein